MAGEYDKNLDEYESIETHWIALHVFCYLYFRYLLQL